MTTAVLPLVADQDRDLDAIGIASILNSTVGAYNASVKGSLTTSTAWPLAKLVAYYPISIAKTFLVQGIWWVNGTSPSGNIEVGVYNESGSRLVTSGSQAAGTSADIQKVTPTAVSLVGPARYYIAVTCDGTPYTIQSSSTTQITGTTASLGVMTETTGSFGLPATWTSPAVLVSSEIQPNAGLCDSTTL